MRKQILKNRILPHTFSHSLRHAGFFVLRAPMLPLETLSVLDYWRPPALLDEHGSLRREDGDSAPAPADLELRDVEAEALYLASPVLLAQLDRHQSEGGREASHRLGLSLGKYRIRMAARCTPFGLFASCSLGRIDHVTNLVLGGLDQLRRRTRLDHTVFFDIADRLLIDDALRSRIGLRLNSSLTQVGEFLHLTKRVRSSGRYQYQLVVLDVDAALLEAIALGKAGTTRAKCIHHFVNDGFPASEASAFVDELIEQQVLVSELEPSLCTDEGLAALIRQVRDIDPHAEASRMLSELHQRLIQLDEAKGTRTPSMYQAVADRVNLLTLQTESTNSLQVDCFRPASLSISDHLSKVILDGAELVRRLSVAENVLTAFRDSFLMRYEQREVPLLEALDPELGIDFASVGAGASAGTMRHGRTLSARDAILHRLLLDAEARSLAVIELDGGTVEAIANASRPAPFPSSFFVNVSLIGSTGGSESECLVVWNGGGGASAASMLGRFCDLDEELRCAVRKLVDEEEHLSPNRVEAEVVHLPQARVGNVLSRPSLRQFEIEYLGRSELPRDRVLTADDLMLSVRDGRLHLRSRRLDCEVLPRLSCAHNFMHETNLPVYQLLCLLQRQGVQTSLTWDWGVFGNSTWLPRIQYRQLVLSRARWLVQSDAFVFDGHRAACDQVEVVRAWRGSRKVPRYVSIVEGDLELLCDLESDLGARLFLSELRSAGILSVAEWIPEGPTCFPLAGEGHYVSEIVLPVLTTAPLDAPTAVPGVGRAEATLPLSRTIPPGGDWLYVKLYCGSGRAERLLALFEVQVIRALQEAGSIDRWFFVRYADPENHLRIRLAVSEQATAAHVFTVVSRWVMERVGGGDPLRLQFETYVREIERYGGLAALELAERVFHEDSEFVTLALRLGVVASEVEFPELIGVQTVDALLDAFDVPMQVRCGLLEPSGLQAPERRALEKRHRQCRAVINERMSECDGRSTEGWQAALQEYRIRLRPLAAALRQLVIEGRLGCSQVSLLRSFIHMHVNRLYASEQPKVERKVCFLLWREYVTRLRRREAEAVSRSLT